MGCVFAEMLSGKVLFKADSVLQQLEEIFKVMGTPEAPALDKIVGQSERVFFLLKIFNSGTVAKTCT